MKAPQDISPDSCNGGKTLSNKSAHSDGSDVSNGTCTCSQDTSGPLLGQGRTHNHKTNGMDNSMVDNSHTVYLPYGEGHGDKRSKTRKKRISKLSLVILIVGVLTFVIGFALITAALILLQKTRCQSLDTAKDSDITVTVTGGPRAGPSVQNRTVHGGYTHSTGSQPGVTYITTRATTDLPPPTATTVNYDTLTNVALGKPADQSSTVTGQGGWYPPSNAVDGQTNTTLASGSCSQTELEIRPYWIVDVGRLKILRTVRIWRAMDCCGADLANFDVRIGQSADPDFNILCRRISLKEHGPSEVYVRCDNPIYGRYVSIRRIEDHPVRLTVCEVMVYDQ